MFRPICFSTIGGEVNEDNAGADPGGVQGVRTPALLITVPFLKFTVSILSPGMH